MVWSDPTDYAANAIPTTSGAETNNINTKVTSKIRQLFDYLHGDDALDFTFKASANTNISARLSGDSQLYQFLGSAGGTVFAIDGTRTARWYESTANGQNYVGLIAPTAISANKVWTLPVTDGSPGYAFVTDGAGSITVNAADAAIIAVQLPGTAVVANTVNRIRIMAPYAFKATEIAAACDNTLGVGSGGTLILVALTSGSAFATVSITPGNSTASTILANQRSIAKNEILTYNITAIGGGTQPAQDINHQIRGYRTGTLTF